MVEQFGPEDGIVPGGVGTCFLCIRQSGGGTDRGTQPATRVERQSKSQVGLIILSGSYFASQTESSGYGDVECGHFVDIGTVGVD